jgi:hypothetical protein
MPSVPPWLPLDAKFHPGYEKRRVQFHPDILGRTHRGSLYPTTLWRMWADVGRLPPPWRRYADRAA